MDIDNFKAFVKTIPSIKDDVISGRYTWQQIYELYIMYGENDKIWEPYKKQGFDMNSIFEVIKNVDLNALSKSFDGILKVLDLLSNFTQNETPKSKKQWYDD